MGRLSREVQTFPVPTAPSPAKTAAVRPFRIQIASVDIGSSYGGSPTTPFWAKIYLITLCFMFFVR